MAEQHPGSRGAHESKLAGRYRALLEHLPQTAIVVFDRELRVELVTGPALDAAGLDPHQLEGLALDQIVPPETARTLFPHYRRALTGEEISLEYRSTLSRRSFWLNIVPLRDERGEIEGGMAVTLDVTDRTAAQDALRRSEERFRRAFDEAPIGMALVSPDGQVRKVNAALSQITGGEPGKLVGQSLAALISPQDADGLDSLRRLTEVAPAGATVERTGHPRNDPSGQLESFRGELRLLHAAGHTIATDLQAAVLRDGEGAPEQLLLQIQDITDRKRFEEQLRFMADHDPLTGLLNRRGFERELISHIARVLRYGTDGALLAMDLDHFKLINDTLGHNAGDELIGRITAVLSGRLRDSDVLARIGGDEFAVLLPSATPERATTVASALLDVVRREQLELGARTPSQITTSIGVTMFDPKLTGQEMLIRADVAMYEAKESGRDRYVFYSSGGEAVPRARSRLTWVERIRAALREDRLCLHAQPIVAINGDSASMHELLLRLVDEEGELVMPGSFLGVAEQFDLVGAIDRWVIQRAIGLLERALVAGNATPVTVNVSPRSLGDVQLLAEIEQLITDHLVRPELLVFEVTETAVIANMHAARTFAQRLRDLGCRLALDDFGSGFGSFLYLKHVPFDFLKIDGEFVTNCLVSNTDRLVIQAVVTLARGLGKQTVAEFTPDQRTLDCLVSLGVDFSQGYFTGAPVPLEQSSLLGPGLRLP